MEAKGRLSHVDLLESIAIFFVIFYHSTLYSSNIIDNHSALYYLRYYGRTVLSTCVPLFFFANGYLLFHKEFALKKHIFKTLRLVILTFLWAFILMPIYLVIAKETLSLKTILLSIFNLDTEWGMNLFWFLCALVCIYIFFPALKALFDTNKQAFSIFTILCIALTIGYTLLDQFMKFSGLVFHHSFTSISCPIVTSFNPFRGMYGFSFAYFCAGGIIHFYEGKILSIPRALRNLISIAGIVVSCTMLFLVGVFFSKFYDGKMWDVVWNGYDSLFTFCNVFFIYVLCLNYRGNNRFIAAVSMNTLGIYFIHGLVIRLSRSWIESIPISGCYTFNILYAFAILSICLLICVLIRRVPFLKKLI